MAETKRNKGKHHKDDVKVRDLTETLQRLQADFENYKKRDAKDKERIMQMTTAAVLQHMLPVLDAFELALKSKNNLEQFSKGMEMIYTQLCNTLKQMGVSPIDTQNAKLDPHKHEVMMKEEKEGADDEVIIEELQKGYMYHNQVLRTSKVKIAKNKEEHKPKNDS
jgi:molecular chaperone GrpE